MKESHGTVSTQALCGRQVAQTKEAVEPPWHVACIGCLIVMRKKRLQAD
jgi:hypothetical protein